MKSFTLIFLFSFIYGITNSQNMSMELDGVNDYAEVSDNAAFNTNCLTIETWIKPNSVSGTEVINGKYNSNVQETSWYLGVEPNGILHFVVYEDHPQPARGFDSDPNILSAGAWQHVAATFDINTQVSKLYVNGVEVNATLVPSQNSNISFIKNSTSPVWTGVVVCGSGSFCSYFGGKIDELRIWNTVRSASEISANYNIELSGPQSGLIAYYKFNELEDLGVGNSGTNDVADLSGNGLHSDLVGGATLVSDAAPLPVELLYFKGKKIDETHVKLTWATASEINNYLFLIEKSETGKIYQEIGMVGGAGTTTSIHEYSFIDVGPYLNSTYYRLKQVDYDGSFSYSNSIVVKTDSPFYFSILPNPSNDIIRFSFGNMETGGDFSIYNEQGFVVYQSFIDSQQPQKTIKISELGLVNGIYVAFFKTENEFISKRFLIID